jgi:hypothetical protein
VEWERNRSPLTAFTHALVQVTLVAGLPAPAPVLGLTEPGAAGGDDAAQECANNALVGLGWPLGGCCVSGCHGNLLEVG